MMAPRGVTKLSEFLPKDKNNLDPPLTFTPEISCFSGAFVAQGCVAIELVPGDSVLQITPKYGL